MIKATLIDHMGSDLSVVNAARVSFGKASEWETSMEFCDVAEVAYVEKKLSDRDKGLIQFLARGCTSGDWDTLVETLLDCEGSYFRSEVEDILNYVRNMPTHWTPFGHTAITLHIKAPIFIARQLGKHQTGMVWNEVSRRYVTDEPEFYVPDVWRKAADNVKQGSSDELFEGYLYYEFQDQDSEVPYELQHGVDVAVEDVVEQHNESSLMLYKNMLLQGICPEMARMVLPQSMLTEWYWTGNLYSFANVFIQRTDSHAQREVQDVAHQIGEIIEPLFPVSWAALTGESK
jgi:thymidylate synthase (FAD)